jgi:hypothetical protein
MLKSLAGVVMGVDASLFAVKAKKYYYFDREYNVNVFDLAWSNGGDSKYEDVMFALTNLKSCDYDRVVYILNKNIDYWKAQPEERDRSRESWNQSLLKFIQMFPNDTFFITTDHEEPPYWDIAEKDGYTQFQFPEDIPEPTKCHCPKAWCPLHRTVEELEQQRQSVEALQKALSCSGSLNIEDGYLEIASLDTVSRKIKI